jgi:hypothetical protein
MKTTDLFKSNRSAKRLNESLEKTFGTKINFEDFDTPKLEDARNKLRTQIHDARSQSGFNETIENETLTKAQWMHDAIVAELMDREEYIVDTTMQEGTDIDKQELMDILKRFDENMNEIGGYGDPDFDKIFTALSQGDVESAVEEVYANYSDQDGGELRNMDDYIEDLEYEFKDLVGESDDEGGETDDGYALASAGFGSDEDYESVNNEGGREMTGTARDRFISTMTPRMDNDALMQKVAKVVNSPEFTEDTILKIVDAGNTVTHPVARYIQKEFEELQYDLGTEYEDYPERVAEKLLSMLIDRTKQGVSEVSLGDYSKKAAMSRAMAQTDRFFDRDDPEAVAAADKTIANRERGMARADARRKPYTPPPVDQEKQRQDLADKYPNIDELVRKAELRRDPDYEMADGQAYYDGRDAEQNYQKLKQIQRMIRSTQEMNTNEAYINNAKDAVNILADIRAQSKLASRGEADPVRPNQLVNDLYDVMQWIEANMEGSIETESAPPGAKSERMVKHIKKGYADDGKLTKKEKGIAYATAWKQHNKEKNESTDTTGEDMRRLQEGEIQQASAIVTAKTMVDRVGRWIEELSGMENDTLLQLGDSIRDEMGQEQSKAFIQAVAPAIQQALETLKGTRDTLSTGVRSLASGEQPADMLGAEPTDMGGDEMAAEPDAMNMGAEMGGEDEFAAAEPAAGGIGDAGREQRESISRSNSLLKVLAG